MYIHGSLIVVPQNTTMPQNTMQQYNIIRMFELHGMQTLPLNMNNVNFAVESCFQRRNFNC